MGTYDEVRVACPTCSAYRLFQSKGGNCEMQLYDLDMAPAAVLSNVNRHSPVQCRCGSWFAVDERTRLSILVDPPEPSEHEDDWRIANEWYRRQLTKSD